jgi:hypothetical protein
MVTKILRQKKVAPIKAEFDSTEEFLNIVLGHSR